MVGVVGSNPIAPTSFSGNFAQHTLLEIFQEAYGYDTANLLVWSYSPGLSLPLFHVVLLKGVTQESTPFLFFESQSQ